MPRVSSLMSGNLSNTITNYETWNGVIYNVKEFQAYGDGVQDDSAFILKAIQSAEDKGGGIVFFPTGNYRIGSDINSPENITLWFSNGAMITVDSGKTVTIDGGIDAGLYQIFSGEGTISGNARIPEIYPQWWGAKTGPSSTAPDSGEAINKAILFAFGMNYDVVVYLTAGNYNIFTPIVIPHGAETNSITLIGYGAVLRGKTTNMRVITVKAVGDPALFLHIGKTRLIGFKIEGDNIPEIGIMIGRDGVTSPYGVDGVFPSIVQDVDIRGCKISCKLSDSRLWQFINCCFGADQSDSYCVLFESTNDRFCGDHWISDSQFSVSTNSANNVCIRGTVSGVSGNSKMAGIHIDNVVCYGRGFLFVADNDDGEFNDIFITACAVDGLDTTFGFDGAYFLGNSLGTCGVVKITNTWFNAAYSAVRFENVVFSSVTGGKVSSTDIAGIRFENTSSCGAFNVSLYDVNRSDNGGGVAILAGAGTGNRIIGCAFGNTSPYVNQFIYIAATQVIPIVTLNTKDSSGTFISNNVVGTEGTEFIVSNNLTG